MDQDLQTAMRTDESLPASISISRECSEQLKTLSRRMGDPKLFRNPDSLRSQLREMGADATIRRALELIAAGPAKATPHEFVTQLGRLATHYWRPDFTTEQSKVLYGDFIRLLDGMTLSELREACDTWIMNPDNRFFPTPGQLRDLVKDALVERARVKTGAEFLANLLDEDRRHSPFSKVHESSDERGKVRDFASIMRRT